MASKSQKHQVSAVKNWRRWYTAMQRLVFLPIKLWFHFSAQRDSNLEVGKNPTLVIAPHQNYLDCVFMALALGIGQPCRFVATDLLASTKFGMWFLSHTGCIPITQFSADTSAIKAILKALKAGDSVAIFPEGERSLSGEHEFTNHTLLRIIKRAEVDLAAVSLEGSYLIWPRYSRSLFSRGKVVAKTQLLATKEQLKTMSEAEILRLLKPIFAQSDYRDQERRLEQGEKLWRYNKRQKPDGLEQLLHYCPKCKQELSLIAKKHSLTCKLCDFSMQTEKSGLLKLNEELISPRLLHTKQAEALSQKYNQGMEFKASCTLYIPGVAEKEEPASLKIDNQGNISYVLLKDFSRSNQSPLTILTETRSTEYELQGKTLVYGLGKKPYVQFVATKDKERRRFYLKSGAEVVMLYDYLRSKQAER